MWKNKASAAKSELTDEEKRFKHAKCDYHDSVMGSCDRLVNLDDRELLPLLYPSIEFPNYRYKVPKVYLILLADVVKKLGPFSTSKDGPLIDHRDLMELTYCGHLAGCGALRRQIRSKLAA
jgi:hypothetical protein